MKEYAGHEAQVMGFHNSIGKIYGLLYLRPQLCNWRLVKVCVNW